MSPPPLFPSIRVFSNQTVLCIRWLKNWSFSFSISPSSEYSELISFRMHWLDLLAVQGTLKSLLQQNSSKASVRQHSPFFTVQLSHPYMTTGKTIALTRQTFVDKVMSMLFNMLSRLVVLLSPQISPGTRHFQFLDVIYQDNLCNNRLEDWNKMNDTALKLGIPARLLYP